MAKHLYGYGLALLCLVVATICRVAFIPVIGYGLIYGLLMICVWVSGHFGGFGPSVFALVVGALLLILLRYLDPTYGWTNLEFQVGLLFYSAVGVVVILLCRSEHIARSSLLQQLAERRVIEDTAQANARRFQAIMQNTSAVIYIKDLQGRFLMVNKRFEELSRHSPVVGKTDADLFQSEIVTTIQAHDQEIRDTGKPLEFEETVPLRDGLHTYVAVKFPIFDSAGQVVAVGGISTDITERKKAQDALEAEQEVLRHTIEVQDHERQLIAYEIHDGLIQYVTGALMQLEALQTHGRDMPDSDKVDSIVGILRRAVAEGRRLIDGIRTPVLDGLGVVAALENLIQEEERAHVQVEFIKDEGLERMDSKIEEAVYRIAQEALTNIGKHSQSKNVRIEIGRRGDMVHLEIRDFGVGFTPSNGVNGIHGLRGMMERARIAGGNCNIESAPDKGTRVVVDLPYQSKK